MASVREPDLPVPDGTLRPLDPVDVAAHLAASSLRLHGSSTSCAVPPAVASGAGATLGTHSFYRLGPSALRAEGRAMMTPSRPLRTRQFGGRAPLRSPPESHENVSPNVSPTSSIHPHLASLNLTQTRSNKPYPSSLSGRYRVAMQKVNGSSPFIRLGAEPNQRLSAFGRAPQVPQTRKFGAACVVA